MVDLFEPLLRAGLRLGTQVCKIHRLPKFHFHPAGARETGTSAKSFVRSKNANRHNGRIGLDHHQADSRADRLELAIAAPRAFGKQENCPTLEQSIKNGPQASRATAFAIHW